MVCKHSHLPLITIRSYLSPPCLLSEKCILFMCCCGVWICIFKLYFLFLLSVCKCVGSWCLQHVFHLTSWTGSPAKPQNVKDSGPVGTEALVLMRTKYCPRTWGSYDGSPHFQWLQSQWRWVASVSDLRKYLWHRFQNHWRWLWDPGGGDQ